MNQTEPRAVPLDRSPPKCSTLPLVGELPFLLAGGLDHLVALRQRRGDVFTLDLEFTQLVVLSHPRHAQQILRDRARIYGKGNALWNAIRGLIGNGLAVSEGDFWLRQRRMIQPHFSRERLAAMVRLMVHAIEEELAAWERYAASGQPVDLFREMTRITMRVIVRTMFGTKLEPRTADLVGQQMSFVLDYMLTGMVTQRLPKWAPLPGRQRFQQAVQKIDGVLFDIIEQRRRTPQSEGGELISMLLEAVDAETHQAMTAQELRDEAIAMFLAGYETTASALAFAFHHLLSAPQAQKTLQDEIDGVLGGRQPEFADLRRLPFSLAVVQEALRLHGPAYWILRTAQEDDEIDGYRVRKGQEVAIMLYVIHRHPEQWREPQRFDPSRFSAEETAARHPLAWIPFGVGQRICVGKEFALMEGQLILASILSRYQLHPEPGRSVKVHLGTTLRPKDGVWVRLQHRSRP